ncbi:hypothetical protein CH289_01865 [Rhodococcus sp. RS1C4]|uniref:DUF1707 SHOCT-like domain-containing protein n=1 Tax=Nocardiaceae TaxID=85025 RepID=UPI00037372E9|nr:MULTISPECIES: DUF1707 domain-containing protein [Rhodococcus]OZC55341.1 hypothetical protein CH267_12140 [Rhodococcus sp. 06-621-2]OZC58338.1 hypothetical protein CH289_01865 [Rhodococcus sp. RS1C4]OZC88173.1 hypothetical protein CH282_08500 [Rhodococcus sp. 06-418-1B]OZD11744.1 hypothetical protein CH280_18395 [Rhodococcus sp. 06-156-4C]OZD15587.1 hypothetical protein CH248_23015 [Rhodococcus sp. 06-156-4a]
MSDHLPEQNRESVRAADADRNLVAKLLSDALAGGQLTVSEYDERTAAAYRAKTYGELDVLTSDLALTPPTEALYSAPSRSTDRAVAIMSGFERKGEWTVAPRVEAVAFWGGGEIDLRRAHFSAPEVTLNCVAIMGGIDITVPRNVAVEVRGAGIMGGFDHLSQQGAPGAPRIVVTGFAFWGGVSIKAKD